MAPPSLLEIGKEGFDMIDQFYSKNKFHQQPFTYHKPENPPITEKPPVSSQPIYHPSRDQLIAFRIVNPSSIRRVYIYQYTDPIANWNTRTQDHVGGDDSYNRRRDRADALPSKGMDGGEPMTGATKFSGEWRKWNVALTRF